MQLQLSPEDEKFRDEMRTFFTTEVSQEIRTAVAEGRELSKEQIVESQRTLNDAGLAVPHWPEEYGGRGWTELQRHIWNEEMQAACVPLPLAFNASMIGPVIAQFGSKEQKEEFLPKTASLEIWWSQGFSEPDAGSDLASLRTAAVKDGDDYIVNGQKTWTTLGQYGDWIFTLVRTDPEVKKQAGISMLLIDMTLRGRRGAPDRAHRRRPRGQRGLVHRRARAGGQPGRRGEQRLDAGQVPPRQRARRRGPGRARPSACSRAPRSSAPTSSPTTRCCAPAMVELENELLALELTALRVVAHSEGSEPHPASSVLKLKGTELQQAVSELVVDLGGPETLASGEEGDTESWYRRSTPTYLNLRKASIYGGSNEVQRQIISRTILGL